MPVQGRIPAAVRTRRHVLRSNVDAEGARVPSGCVRGRPDGRCGAPVRRRMTYGIADERGFNQRVVSCDSSQPRTNQCTSVAEGSGRSVQCTHRVVAGLRARVHVVRRHLTVDSNRLITTTKEASRIWVARLRAPRRRRRRVPFALVFALNCRRRAGTPERALEQIGLREQ